MFCDLKPPRYYDYLLPCEKHLGPSGSIPPASHASTRQCREQTGTANGSILVNQRVTACVRWCVASAEARLPRDCGIWLLCRNRFLGIPTHETRMPATILSAHLAIASEATEGMPEVQVLLGLLGQAATQAQEAQATSIRLRRRVRLQ